MYESVSKYGGFYIARYETSISNNISTSVRNVLPKNLIGWYNAYNDLYGAVNTSSAMTGMIWGCQWDQIMKWFIDSGIDFDNSLSYGNFEISEEEDSVILPTGSDNSYNFKNIYDMAGNLYEWTQTGEETVRAIRGGCYLVDGEYYGITSVSHCTLDGEDDIGVFWGSRMYMYVK